MLYITHRSRELEDVAHRAVVLRDGHRVGELPVQGNIEDEIVQLMSGRMLETLDAVAHRDRATPLGPPALRLRGLSSPGILDDIDLEVRPGEILGLYGLVGAGRTEIALSLIGELPVSSGSIELLGKPYVPSSTADAVGRGLAYVPEDRKTMGIFPYLSVRENLAAGVLTRRSDFAVIDRAEERSLAKAYVRDLDIKTASIDDRITTLSGGSQQKVILARWLATDPEVLLLDEPTRGIDVTTKAEIHRLIASLAAEGLAVMLISSELPEMLALAHRVVVLRHGRRVAELDGTELDEDRILRAALGSDEVAGQTPRGGDR